MVHMPSGKILISSPTSKSRSSIYRNYLIKCRIFILNLNVPKTKWDGAEEPTINHFYKTDNRNEVISRQRTNEKPDRLRKNNKHEENNIYQVWLKLQKLRRYISFFKLPFFSCISDIHLLQPANSFISISLS